jgi:polyisoprenoid-binding protein YceI
MHMRATPALCAAMVLLAATQPLRAQSFRWSVDSSSVTFLIRNAGLPVRGSFGRLDARVCFDPAHPARGRLAGSIDPKTVDTGIGMRDRHLQRHGYFDVAKYGAIEMESVRLAGAADGYTGTFRLRIRDVERTVEVPFAFRVEGSRARLDGALTIDRLDYGIGAPSMILGEDVEVHVVLHLTRALLNSSGARSSDAGLSTACGEYGVH